MQSLKRQDYAIGGFDMRYPCLVRKKDCKTEVHIELDQEGLGKYGSPLEPVIVDARCNYQDSAKTVLTTEKKLIELSGVALFRGDIAPELPTLSGGTIRINGEERRILSGMKARNPDGTVNYCRLDVI